MVVTLKKEVDVGLFTKDEGGGDDDDDDDDDMMMRRF
jgi:hypothetical protein